MKNRNEKLIAMFDSLRSKNKGKTFCVGVDCDDCMFNGCMLDPSSKNFDLKEAIEIIDNYELPIKEYTLEELENLPKGTEIEVFQEQRWKKVTFITTFAKNIYCVDGYGTGLIYFKKARPIQEVK